MKFGARMGAGCAHPRGAAMARPAGFILALPILTWFRRHLVSETFGVKPSHEPIDWQLLIPGLISAVILLAFSYGLLRWLYFAEPKPVQEEPEAGEPADSADSAAL